MYEDVTYQKILERMLNRVSSKFDKREGSVIHDTHSPTAIELQILYIELDNIIKESFGDTASREFLILRCRERGITPYEATNAVLQGEFTPTNIDVTGKRFSLNELNYVVTEKIADGRYYVQCETAGVVGNQYLGNMIPIEYIQNLQTAQLTAVLIPGDDEEDTEDLRQRYFDSFGEFAFGGNRADYYEKVKAIDGVGDLKIERVWNSDVNPSDFVINTTVENWYNNIKGSLNATVRKWLDAVYSYCDDKKFTVGGTVLITVVDSDDYGVPTAALISNIQNTLDPETNSGEGYGLAPIGHIVNVVGATSANITVSATISFNDGYTWDNTKAKIQQAVEDYFLMLRKSWADNNYLVIRISQIESRILNVEGVVDILNTKINSQTSNYTLSKYQIPILVGVNNV